MNYYNEFDPYAAQWLRNLMAKGLIPDGIVDERSIAEVEPSDLAGFTQCHFFAGIGGWPLALQIAGWPSDRPAWTGSCPCQPFSAAGTGKGFDDERHLWPVWQRLIAECRPSIIFGEQVAGQAVGPWLDLVQDDLEALGYAFGAVAFPAAGVGAPHIRDRTYWVADSNSWRWEAGRHARRHRAATESGKRNWSGHAGSDNIQARMERMANADCQRRERRRSGETSTQPATQQRSERFCDASSGCHDRASPVNGHWSAADWLGCRDGKWRPVEPGTFPLAHGLPGRVGRLRAYGNAIVPQQAAEFIKATGF